MRERDLLAILKQLVDEKSGVVRNLHFPPLHSDDPELANAYAQPADTMPVFGRRALNDGRAVSVRPERAAIKAVCEAIERYCAAGYDERALTLGHQADMEGRVAGPNAFALYSDAQHAAGTVPFSHPTETGPIRWVQASSIASGEPVWVPAQFVFIPYEPAPAEPVFDNLQSTGLACGSSRADAILGGLLEVIERDAFMVAWRTLRPGRPIDVTHPALHEAQVLMQRLRSRSLKVRATALENEAAVPVIMVAISNDGNQCPHVVCGFGTSLDPDRAILLALEEAALGQILLRRSARTPDVAAPECPASLVEHAMRFALDPDARKEVDFLFDGTPTTAGELDPGTMDAAVARLARAGFEPLHVDITTPDISDCGLSVVKVLVPGMQPLDLDHRHLHLGGHRLDQGVVNWQPHPFP